MASQFKVENLLVSSYKGVMGCTPLIQSFGKARRFSDRFCHFVEYG